MPVSARDIARSSGGFRLIAAAVTLAVLLPQAQAQYGSVDDKVRARFELVVSEVARLRSQLERNDCISYDLVDELLSDQFDFRQASRLILRSEWPDDPDVQERFVGAFYDALVARYGWVLAHLDEQTLRIDAPDRDPLADRQTLTGTVTFNDGTTASIRLQMLMRRGEWRIVDVKAESYSFVEGFRRTYLDYIGDSGLDGLIASLEAEAAPRRECGL